MFLVRCVHSLWNIECYSMNGLPRIIRITRITWEITDWLRELFRITRFAPWNYLSLVIDFNIDCSERFLRFSWFYRNQNPLGPSPRYFPLVFPSLHVTESNGNRLNEKYQSVSNKAFELLPVLAGDLKEDLTCWEHDEIRPILTGFFFFKIFSWQNTLNKLN